MLEALGSILSTTHTHTTFNSSLAKPPELSADNRDPQISLYPQDVSAGGEEYVQDRVNCFVTST
jgi:hypothetical protein